MKLIVSYKNWRGITSRRMLKPNFYYWGSTKHHPEQQWLLNALDLIKGEVREFALADMEVINADQVWDEQKDFRFKIELLSKGYELFFDVIRKHVQLHQIQITHIDTYSEMFPMFITFKSLKRGEEDNYYVLCLQSEYEYHQSLLNSASTGVYRHIESIEEIDRLEHNNYDFVLWRERHHKEETEDLIESVATRADEILGLAAQMDRVFGSENAKEHLRTAIMGGLMDTHRNIQKK